MKCRCCDESQLDIFLRLGNLPPSDGLVREQDLSREDPRHPLEVARCPNCSLVQLTGTLPPESLFGESFPYYSSFSDALLAHSRANVEEILAQRSLDAHSLVVELASNDGYLLQYYRDAGIPVLGIDPADGPVRAAREKGIQTLHEFFTTELAEQLAAEGKQADVLHANNVLAHVADTAGFVRGIRRLLKPTGLAVLEVPYVHELVRHCEFDTIYHEHLCYFSVTALTQLFARQGLHLNDVAPLSIHGGSLRLYVEHEDRPSARRDEFLAREQQIGMTAAPFYADFSQRVEEVKRQVHSLVMELHDKGHRIAAYGAAAKGCMLLNACQLGSEVIDFVVDRNDHKHGKYLPGVRVPVVPVDRLLQDFPDYTLLLPWNFRDEILAQQAEYRARGGHFIVPIPRPEIV